MYICQYQLYYSILNCIRNRDILILCGISTDCAAFTAAGTCPAVDIIPVQLCSTWWQVCSELPLGKQIQCTILYLIYYCPIIRWFILYRPTSCATTINFYCQKDELFDCSKSSYSRHSLGTVMSATKPSNRFRYKGVPIDHSVPTNSNKSLD